MHQKTIRKAIRKTIKIISFLGLGLFSVSISLGLVGCMGSKDSQSAQYPPESEFDQDEDPYPDEYLLDDFKPASKDSKNNKKPNKARALAPAALKTQLQTLLPGVQIESVSKGPVPYLYQVKTQGDVFFITTDGQLMLVGDLIALDGQRQNYTEQARMEDRAVLLKALKPDSTINFDPKNPAYTVTVFTDTDCAYCRQLHQEVEKLNALGIAVHYAAFPRAGKQSKTFETMQSIWCADSKKAAFNAVIQGEALAKSKACTSQDVTQQYDLGEKLGIRGTPSLLLADGTLIPGYIPAQNLKAMLDEHYANAKPANKL